MGFSGDGGEEEEDDGQPGKVQKRRNWPTRC